MTLALKDLAGRTIARANPSYSKVAEWVRLELAYEFSALDGDISYDENRECWLVFDEAAACIVDEAVEARELLHWFPDAAYYHHD
jgi:hypothetical protein